MLPRLLHLLKPHRRLLIKRHQQSESMHDRLRDQFSHGCSTLRFGTYEFTSSSYGFVEILYVLVWIEAILLGLYLTYQVFHASDYLGPAVIRAVPFVWLGVILWLFFAHLCYESILSPPVSPLIECVSRITPDTLYPTRSSLRRLLLSK